MVTTFNGVVSSSQQLCGGGPQGSLLIVLLFCLQVNLAGEPCPRIDINPVLPLDHFGPQPLPSYSEDTKPCHSEEQTIKKIYIDDLSILESIDLRKWLIPIGEDIIGPQPYYERCGLFLPAHNSILQHKLEDMQHFTNKNLMLINKKKTVIMPFNFSHNYDFIPPLSSPGDEVPLDVTYETNY